MKTNRLDCDSALATQRMQEEAGESIAQRAETLVEVIRYRGVHDASRTHLIITEDDEQGEHAHTLTFGELATAAQKCAEELARRGVPAGGRVALDAADFAAVFCLLRRNFAGGRGACADLSAISSRPHRRVRRAAIRHSEQRGSVPAADVSSRRSSGQAAAAAGEIAAGRGGRGEIAGRGGERATAGTGRAACISQRQPRAQGERHRACCNTPRDRLAIRRA